MEDRIVFAEQHSFYETTTEESPEVVERQKEMLGMKPRKTFQEARREVVKSLIESSSNVEEADKIINEKYNFKTIGEKIAFLKGMFDVRLVSKHDGEGVSEEKSAEMDYWAILNATINI